MKAVRAAIGPGKSIMIDCGVRNSWSLMDSIRRVRAFEEYGLDWIEEPLGHDDPLGYAQLKAAVTSKIAYGEREYRCRESTASSHGLVRRLGLDRAASAASRLLPLVRSHRARQPARGQRARLVDRDRHRREPRDLVGQAGLPPARGAAVQGPAATTLSSTSMPSP